MARLRISREESMDTRNVGKRSLEPTWLVGFLSYCGNIVNLLYTRGINNTKLPLANLVSPAGASKRKKNLMPPR